MAHETAIEVVMESLTLLAGAATMAAIPTMVGQWQSELEQAQMEQRQRESQEAQIFPKGVAIWQTMF